MEIYQSGPTTHYSETDEKISLCRFNDSVETSFFDISDLDLDANGGVLRARFENVKGNFNVFVGIVINEESVKCDQDIKEKDGVYCFSAYDG